MNGLTWDEGTCADAFGGASALAVLSRSTLDVGCERQKDLEQLQSFKLVACFEFSESRSLDYVS